MKTRITHHVDCRFVRNHEYVYRLLKGMEVETDGVVVDGDLAAIHGSVQVFVPRGAYSLKPENITPGARIIRNVNCVYVDDPSLQMALYQGWVVAAGHEEGQDKHLLATYSGARLLVPHGAYVLLEERLAPQYARTIHPSFCYSGRIDAGSLVEVTQTTDDTVCIRFGNRIHSINYEHFRSHSVEIPAVVPYSSFTKELHSISQPAPNEDSTFAYPIDGERSFYLSKDYPRGSFPPLVAGVVRLLAYHPGNNVGLIQDEQGQRGWAHLEILEEVTDDRLPSAFSRLNEGCALEEF